MLDIYEGQILKNYKHVCELLKVTPAKGKGKIYHMKEFERYCKYHKNGHQIVVDKVYETPLEKVDGRKDNGKNERVLKEYSQLLIEKHLYDSIGVYCIQNNHQIYVGSTLRGFRKRFQEHFQPGNYKSNHNTRQMLDNGAQFKILEVFDLNESEKNIRRSEYMWIHHFITNTDYEVINLKNPTCVKHSTKIKTKSIKVLQQNYDEAIRILEQERLLYIKEDETCM